MPGPGNCAARFRPALPADAPALARLNRLARAAAMPGLQEPQSEAGVARFLAAQLIPRQHVMVAETSEATPLGYIAFGAGTSAGVTVFDLYIDPAWHRRGLGRRLLGEAIAAAGPAPLTLYCFARNHVARAFYDAAGFRIIGGSTDNEEGEPDLTYHRPADLSRTARGATP